MSTPLDAIREIHGEKNYAPRVRLASVKADSGMHVVNPEAQLTMHYEYDYIVSLEIFFRQRINRGESSNPQFINSLMERGKRAIAARLYEDVTDRLIKIYCDLECDGRDREELRELSALISELRGHTEGMEL